MKLELEGRVAIITGSGRGIGKSAAEAFAREGAHVVVTDIDEAAAAEVSGALRAQGFSAIGVAAKVCDAQAVERLASETIAAFGKIDVLVNNAGFTRDKYLTKMPAADWDSVVDTILKGAFLCTKAVLPSMIEQRWGRIINISSRAHLGNPGQTNYSAAKAGLIGFTSAGHASGGRYAS